MPPLSHDALPDDVTALKAMVLEQGYLIAKLKTQLASMRRHRFGSSSESLDQLELLIEALETDQAKLAVPESAQEAGSDDKVQPKRKPLPEQLPREEIVYAPKADCIHCGKPMRPGTVRISVCVRHTG